MGLVASGAVSGVVGAMRVMVNSFSLLDSGGSSPCPPGEVATSRFMTARCVSHRRTLDARRSTRDMRSHAQQFIAKPIATLSWIVAPTPEGA